jgi:ferrous iron transport protein A
VSKSVKDAITSDPLIATAPLIATVSLTTPYPLTATKVGDRVRIVSLNCGESNNRLMGMGLIPGAVLEVMSSTATGSVIVSLQDHRLGLGAEMAERIQVIDADQPIEIPQPILMTKIEPMQTTSDISPVKLRDAAIGSVLRVIGYEPTARDYKRKLLAMGLTPGTQLRVTRHAPLGDPTEIEVRDFHLSLRKDEADALIVTSVTGEAS